MSLFINFTDKKVREKVRIKKIIIFIIILWLLLMGFDFYKKSSKLKEIPSVKNTPTYNFTPTPTMTPVPYPQLFYFKTKINENLKLPGLNTHYILSGNNDKNYKYWYVLITSPASDDITFISYMIELGENAIEFENIGNNTKNARYKFVKGLLNWEKYFLL